MTGLNRAGIVEDAFAMVGICTVGVAGIGALVIVGDLAVSAAIIAGQWWRGWNSRRVTS